MQTHIFHAVTGREKQTLQWRVCPGHAEMPMQTMSTSIGLGQRPTRWARSARLGRVGRCPVALATGVPLQTSPHGRCNNTFQPIESMLQANGKQVRP